MGGKATRLAETGGCEPAAKRAKKSARAAGAAAPDDRNDEAAAALAAPQHDCDGAAATSGRLARLRAKRGGGGSPAARRRTLPHAPASSPRASHNMPPLTPRRPVARRLDFGPSSRTLRSATRKSVSPGALAGAPPAPRAARTPAAARHRASSSPMAGAADGAADGASADSSDDSSPPVSTVLARSLSWCSRAKLLRSVRTRTVAIPQLRDALARNAALPAAERAAFEQPLTQAQAELKALVAQLQRMRTQAWPRAGQRCHGSPRCNV
jgi:hypothetical protein